MSTVSFVGVQMIIAYGCGGALANGSPPPTHTNGVIVLEIITYPSFLVMVYGTLMGQRSVDDVRSNEGSLPNGLPRTIFQQDNTLPHKT
ncbi:hypothetical protein TNCV_3424431 [Trichonephila clavipes]|nr:hypothetical protein TNCV_3424431 [Trichonephila clavipes]